MQPPGPPGATWSRPGEGCATTVRYMDLSLRELRHHIARVFAAIESGEPVVLTVGGRPVADIVPRQLRSESRPSERLLADLEEICRLAGELDVESDPRDFDVGLTTDDVMTDDVAR